MTRSMGRPLALVRLLACLAMTAGFVVGVSPAFACSCVRMDPVAMLPDADGAFVGTYVDRTEIGDQRVAFTFEVERVVKGDFGPTAIVRTNQTGGSCGLEFYGDRRTGLLLQKAGDGVWESGLCSMVEPSALLTAGDHHAPNSEVAPVGVPTPSESIVVLVGAGVTVGAVLALLLWSGRRSAARRDEPA